jgi:hypothetical protein
MIKVILKNPLAQDAAATDLPNRPDPPPDRRRRSRLFKYFPMFDRPALGMLISVNHGMQFFAHPV